MSILILINGEEEYLIDRAVNDEIGASLATTIRHFYTKDELQNYELESQVLPADGSARVFIIWDVVSIPPLPGGPHDTLIAVLKKPIQDARAKRVLSFPRLKTFDNNNEVLRWIMKEGDRVNIDLTRVAPALFVNSGNCLRKLASEIAKLAVMVPPGGIVSPDDARSILCFSAELTPGPIVDALCDGHTAKAVSIHDKLQEANDETGWIIAYLHRFALQQLRFELLLELKMSDSDAASSLGISPFIYKRWLTSRRGVWSKQSLLKSINTMAELDVNHKLGKESSKFGLIMEIIRLSEEARNVKR